MPLADALLFDAYRDPKEVWIAIRSDGQKGSGTQSDPYDGSTIKTSAVSINLSRSGLVATATTSAPHGFSTGNLVIIGVPGALESDWWDGWFVITWLSNTSFTYTMKKAPATTTAADRYVQKTVEFRFDERLGELGANGILHIGPGLFQTQGAPYVNNPDTIPWRPKSGQRILGAGMGLTTVRLVGASDSDKDYAAFQNSQVYLDGFQMEDLTIDCNLDGQPTVKLNCAALQLTGGGRNIHIRRVRAINFGSRAIHITSQNPTGYSENFPLAITTGLHHDSSDTLFEECVAERPAPDVYWNSTLLAVGGGEVNGTNYYAIAAVLRNNYVNGQLVFGQRAEISGIIFEDGVATITTKTPHGHTKPGNVSVQGILVGNSISNAFNGVFAIDTIVTATVLKYTPYPLDGPTATDLVAGPHAVLGAPVSPHILPIRGDQISVSGQEITITLPIPHNRTKENLASIGGIVVNDLQPTDPANLFNGALQITNVLSKTQLVYKMKPETPGSPPAQPPYSFAGSDAGIGQGHIALTADAGTAAVVEGNRVLHIHTGGPWTDFWSTRDQTTRDNYYYDVATGPNQGRGQRTAYPRGCSLRKDLTNPRIAICTPDSGTHDLMIGQGVMIFGVEIGGSIDNPFNSPHLAGTQQFDPFVVKEVSTADFKYEMRSPPSVNPDPGSTPTFAGLDYVLNLVWENNIIELQLTRPEYWSQPTGMYAGLGSPGFVFLPDAAYRFRNVVIQRNIIRQLSPPSVSSYAAITVQKAQNATIDANIISLGQAVPIQFDRCGRVTTFNNTSAGGKLIQAYSRQTQTTQSEFIDDALLLALL